MNQQKPPVNLNVTVPNPPQRSFRSRRRRGGVNVNIQAGGGNNNNRNNNNNNGNTNGRTRRNRRRRQRKRALARVLGSAPVGVVNTPYYSRYFTHTDPSMEASVHRAIQSLFYPQNGIHRSVATGLEPTGLTYYQGSFGMGTTATNNVVTFLAVPALIAKAAVAGQVTFIQYGIGTGLVDPRTTNTGQTAGPFSATNPMTDGRVVSFTMNIIPDSVLTNRGGAGKIGYVSDYTSLNWTNSDFDNLAISKSMDGAIAMSMHWVPAVGEYDFGTGTSTSAGYSGLCGYIVTQLGTPVHWRVEWQIGIEYNPTATYRPLIDRKVPKTRPDARYFINEVVQQHWSPLMICTLENFEQRMSISESLGGYADIQYMDHAGTGGIGLGLNPADADVEEAFIEDMSFQRSGTGSGSAFQAVGRFVKEKACDLVQDMTGENVCGEPIRAGMNLASRALRGGLRNQGNYALGI